ncbi:MAG TPA: deoxyribonuclease IV [Acidobacteriaceae bacterium]|nr:deoxyribonuclease IV [Acidobacteriaceae bacterium]
MAPKPTSQIADRLIGVHLSTTGGVANAVRRAPEIGANTLQIFSSSPRMWRAGKITAEQARQTRAARAELGVGPLVIHTSYLVNVCSQSDEVRQKSIVCFRGEIERALALGAEYLVIHPGSYRGMTRAQGLTFAAESIERAIDGVPWQGTPFQILIENTAGAEHSLGGSFEQVAELIECLRKHAPVAACLDTCHTHVSGYDIVSEAGWAETVAQVEKTIGCEIVRVWHCNDAKAARGSKLDRHQHIGEGQIGLDPFRRLLREPKFAHCAFIAETPVDAPGDEERNVRMLRGLSIPVAATKKSAGPTKPAK